MVDRMLRLERSLVRLEHTNSLMLRVMQQLVDAARGGRGEGAANKSPVSPDKA